MNETEKELLKIFNWFHFSADALMMKQQFPIAYILYCKNENKDDVKFFNKVISSTERRIKDNPKLQETRQKYL